MLAAKKFDTYRTTAVQTATPGNLLLMLYDGVNRFLGTAIEAFKQADPLKFNLVVHQNVSKAQAIIRELQKALRPERESAGDGDLANNLAELYNYFDRRLNEANVKKDKEMIVEVRDRMNSLREAWSESYSKLIQDNAPPSDANTTATSTTFSATR
ncbi:MAG: flagellar export chaperone FliS [Pedosphaera sp.]|nr:flagellar export chaperone FliS [Pedosphaera sp.]